MSPSLANADPGVHWSSKHGGYVDASGTPLPRRSHGPRFAGRAALFLLVFAAQMLGWNALRGSSIERLVVDEATVRPAAWMVNQLTPSVRATAKGTVISAPGGGLNILNGCEGIDALFLLVSAFVVAPLPLRSRALGLLLGAVLLYAVNQARILLLFYTWRSEPGMFATLHGTVTPIVVVLIVAGYFYAWLQRPAPRPAAAV